MTRRRGAWLAWGGVAVGVAVLVAVAVAAVTSRMTAQPTRPAVAAEGLGPTTGSSLPESLVTQGALVARAGNCMACHTARGGAPGAGGRPIDTPFGTVYSANLTPHEDTGLGRWTPDDLWRALHEGRSRDGRRLVPACPYTSFTHVSRGDVDALHAWLRTVPATASPNRAHDLRFPYQTQWALAAWQFLFFEPGGEVSRADRSAQWNRGAYLVRGLGHCAECHTPRNVFGALRDAEGLAGARMPGRGWYAPSLADPAEAGVTHDTLDDVVALLQHGVSRQGSAAGPMAEVVHGSTSHLPGADLRAIAVYLADLPRPPARSERRGAVPAEAGAGALAVGRAVYEKHCAECHGDAGEGMPGAYPALAGHRAVTMSDPINVLRAVLGGGFAPTTAGNPRPHGMPPYASVLDDAEVAAVASYIRSAWGNAASAVTEIEVLRLR